jgi:hypothetical protein
MPLFPGLLGGVDNRTDNTAYLRPFVNKDRLAGHGTAIWKSEAC